LPLAIAIDPVDDVAEDPLNIDTPPLDIVLLADVATSVEDAPRSNDDPPDSVAPCPATSSNAPPVLPDPAINDTDPPLLSPVTPAEPTDREIDPEDAPDDEPVSSDMEPLLEIESTVLSVTDPLCPLELDPAITSIDPPAP
jgi:hypothetical protein